MSVFCFHKFLNHYNYRDVHVRLIGSSKLAVSMSVTGCFSLNVSPASRKCEDIYFCVQSMVNTGKKSHLKLTL